MTGAVASERVSEAPKGSLRMVGNHSKSAKAEGSLTATPTGGAGTKVGLSDPVVLSGCHRSTDKSYLGITGLSLPRVHIDGVVWQLDVGSSHPGAVVCPKGWAVRPLKRYASWVQNVVRQFGPYSGAGGGNLIGAVLSTRGPGWTDRWCICCTAKCIAE